MSANFTAAYPHSWLQPVQYDLDEYRQFVVALDGDLADLVETHRTVRTLLPARQSSLGVERDGAADSQPPAPPGHSSSC